MSFSLPYIVFTTYLSLSLIFSVHIFLIGHIFLGPYRSQVLSFSDHIFSRPYLSHAISFSDHIFPKTSISKAVSFSVFSFLSANRTPKNFTPIIFLNLSLIFMTHQYFYLPFFKPFLCTPFIFAFFLTICLFR